MQTEHINITTSTSSLEDSGIILRKGEIYKCKIIDFVAGKAVIDINNRHILADSEIPLAKGEELFLEVKGFVGDHVELKVSSINNSDIKGIIEILNKFNLEPNEKNISICKFFIKNDIPFDLINVVTSSIKVNSKLSDEDIYFLIKLVGYGITVDSKALQIRNMLLWANTFFKDKFEELFLSLKELSLRHQVTESIRSLLLLFPDFDKENLSVISEKISNLINSQLVSIESLLSKLESETTFESFQSISILLNKALDEIENMSTLKKKEKENIVKKLKEVKDCLKLVNLTNVLLDNGHKEIPFVVAYLPLLFDDKIVDSELHIYVSKKKKIDPDNLFLVLILRLIKLGTVEVHIL